MSIHPMNGTMSRRLLELLAVLVGALTPACGDRECSGAPDPPGVLVVDSVTAMPICSATVELRDGTHVQTKLVSEFSPIECVVRFEGRTGQYVVTASAPGYRTASTDMQVEEDRCGYLHVEPSGPRGSLPGFADTLTLPLEPL
jgi:hypothetical protein